MWSAVFAIIAVILGCSVYIYKKDTNNVIDGPCSAPENGDVKFDTVCERHLTLSNAEPPASLEE